MNLLYLFSLGETSKLRLIFIFLIFALTTPITYSQNTENKVWYNVVSVPPSPNAASLGIYGEVPVDKSTGLPSISIPIFSIAEGDIEVPISISYHAGGIKVQDESSLVGLGWSLNAGGCITRSMRGKPDEFGYLNNCSKVPYRQMVDKDFGVHARMEGTYEFINQVAQGLIDFEPDIFYYNIGGISGSFMFGNYGEPVQFPDNDLKIEMISGNINTSYGISGFRIIAPDGKIYNFKNYEITGVNSMEGETTEYISSWYLDNISSLSTVSEIKFIYNNITNNHQRGCSSLSKSYEYDSNTGLYQLVSSSPSYDYSKTLNMRVISKIISKNGEVNFHYSISEENLPKIDSIQFCNRVAVLSYDFFTNNSSGKERLKLLQLTEKAIGSVSRKVHSFEYNPLTLPHFNSNSIDHWGFFNGKDNSSKIPKYEIGTQTLGDADRNPDPESTQACVLEKIIYPTGGHSKFSYGSNSYYRNYTIEEIEEPEFRDYYVHGESDTEPTCITWLLNLNENLEYRNFRIEGRFDNNSGYYDPEFRGSVKIKNENGIVIESQTQMGDDDEFNLMLNPNLGTPFSIELCAQGISTKCSARLSYKKYDPTLLNIGLVIAGGLRIEKISNYDPVSDQTNYKSYDYADYGRLTSLLPNYHEYTINRRVVGQTIKDFQVLFLYSSPSGGLGWSSNSITYDTVVEYLGTEDINTGSIKTSFYQFPDPPIGGPPFCPKISYQYLRSKITQEQYYSTDKVLTKETIYTYEVDSSRLHKVTGFKASRRVSVTFGGILQNFYDGQEFWYSNFTLKSILLRAKKIESNEYDLSGNRLNTTQNFFYETDRHLNPSRVETYNSEGKIVKTIFKYNPDYIDSSNNCKQSYENVLDLCRTNYQECMHEVNTCDALYNQCANQSWLCRMAMQAAIEATCTTLLGGLNLNCPAMDLFDCIGEFNQCLIDVGYIQCVLSNNCGYMSCLMDANSSFNACNKNYYDNLDEQYESETDPNIKAVLLMSKLFIKNALIEKQIFVDGIMVEHYKFNHSIKLLDNNEIPVQTESLIKYGNGEFKSKIVYNGYDSYLNINQLTHSGIGLCKSYIWGYMNQYPICEANNSTILECGHTGFENNELNGWTKWDNNNTFDSMPYNVFTGKRAMRVSNSSGPYQVFTVGRNAENHSGYKASVWVKGCSDAYLHIEVNGQWSSHVKVTNPVGVDTWHLLEVELPRARIEPYFNQGVNLKIKVYLGTETGQAYFDDLRFYPMDAQMTTYTYEPLVGVTSVSDVNNKPTTYEYDGFGRLVVVKDFLGNILKKYDYHYWQ